MYQNNLLRAIRFANRKHTEVGQRRKYQDAPYIVHPIAVMRHLMLNYDVTNEQLVAAVLHDTVEDTKTTFDEIESNFGGGVRDLVYWLTDVAVPSDGNRATRMGINRSHSALAPSEAQTIKAADSIDNLKSIVNADLGFAFKYVPEKRALFNVLTKADPLIMKEFDAVLTWSENYLKNHPKRKK